MILDKDGFFRLYRKIPIVDKYGNSCEEPESTGGGTINTNNTNGNEALVVIDLPKTKEIELVEENKEKISNSAKFPVTDQNKQQQSFDPQKISNNNSFDFSIFSGNLLSESKPNTNNQQLNVGPLNPSINEVSSNFFSDFFDKPPSEVGSVKEPGEKKVRVVNDINSQFLKQKQNTKKHKLSTQSPNNNGPLVFNFGEFNGDILEVESRKESKQI